MENKSDRSKLIEAFDHMVEDVSEAMHEAEEALAPTVDEMIHNAQVLARDLYSISQEESETLAQALRDELADANKVINQQRKEFKDWLSFDFALVEDKFLELVERAADKTWLDLRAFGKSPSRTGHYKTGEISTAGSFSCNHCKATIQLTKSSHMPPCPKCGERKFERINN